MKKKKTVSLCMIVKNEEDTLERCLNSVKDLVDEFIIIDTGSTDNTKKIAEQFGAIIYDFVWENDFSKARNFSLTKPTCDWILILDADEEFNQSDKNSFIELINTETYDGYYFVFHNYIGNDIQSDYTIHHGLRLIKNNNEYEFIGEIHEQIHRKDGECFEDKIAFANILLFHYGYLTNAIISHDKRKRNIPILIKQLEKEPENPFYLFNLGNEYLALSNPRKALQAYAKAYTHMDTAQVYAIHLYYRMIICLEQLEEYDHANIIADEASLIYPECTEIEYLRGIIYFKKNLHICAISSFLKCIQMGESPSNLQILNGCSSCRSYSFLGDIYLINEDYDHAIDCFTRAIHADNSKYSILYKLGTAFAKKYKDKYTISMLLARYFSNLTHAENLILLADILISEKAYNQAMNYLNQIQNYNKYENDIIFLESKIQFYQKNFHIAKDGFQKLIDKEKVISILPNIKKESIKYSSIIYFLDKFDNYDLFLSNIHQYENDVFFQIYIRLYNFFKNEPISPLDCSTPPENYISIMDKFLDELLKVDATDLFENLISFLYFIDSNKILLSPAKLYYKHGYHTLAVKTIFRSIKEFDMIDEKTSHILLKNSHIAQKICR